MTLTQFAGKVVTEHRDQGHTVKETINEINGKPEYKCVTCKAMIAWQVPDYQIPEEKEMELHVGLAMRLGLDGDTIDHLLLQGGFDPVTLGNFDEAVRYLRNNALPPAPQKIGWW